MELAFDGRPKKARQHIRICANTSNRILEGLILRERGGIQIPGSNSSVESFALKVGLIRLKKMSHFETLVNTSDNCERELSFMPLRRMFTPSPLYI